MTRIKLSIIIPNYNCEKYLVDCLKSIYNQNYKDYEVVIIDDGSTDNSVGVIETYIKGKKNFKLIKQPNMNASIARNKGIQESVGDYIYFLDSDDVVTGNGLNELVKTIENQGTDLCIGNYYEINDNYEKLYQSKLENEKFNGTMNLSKISPVPSNKLFKKDIILKNNIYFANVNIGQDLNFYLKYLSCCKDVSIISSDIYMHRIVSSGMTQNVSFKIFDITKNFDEIKKYYIKTNKEELYNEYIKEVQFKHYFWQMNKLVKCKNRKMKKIILDYFCFNISKIELNTKELSKSSKRDYVIYSFNKIFRFFTCSRLYGFVFKKIMSKRGLSF